MKKFIILTLMPIVLGACVKENKDAAPSDLNAVSVSPTRVKLTWKDNTKGESKFNIERKTDSSTYVLIGTTAANYAQFTDTTVSDNSSYTYRVCAYRNGVFALNSVSPFSNEITVKTDPAWMSEGLIAYFPFNGNANDESGNGNNGKVFGAALTNDRFSKNNSAYFFNGIDNFIDCGNFSKNTYNQISISCWVQKSTFTNLYEPIISKGDPFNVNSEFWLGTKGSNSSTICLFSYNYSGSGLTNRAIWSSIGFDASVSSWYHVVLILDTKGSSMLYAMGFGPSEHPTKLVNASTPITLKIGADIASVKSYWNGSIDDIRIYNRRLTEEEISYLATH